MLIICNVHPIIKVMLVDLSPYFEIVQMMVFFFTSTMIQTMSKDGAYVILQDTETQTQFASNLGHIHVTWHKHIGW